MLLRNLTFPIYQLPNICQTRKLLGYTLVRTYRSKWKILDKPSLPGNLGARRLAIKYALKDRRRLQKIIRACWSISDVMNLKYSKWFIDGNGKLFEYQTKAFYRIHCHRILQQELCETYTLLHLSRLTFPIKVPRPVSYLYAHVVEGTDIIFNYSNEPVKTYRRKL